MRAWESRDSVLLGGTLNSLFHVPPLPFLPGSKSHCPARLGFDVSLPALRHWPSRRRIRAQVPRRLERDDFSILFDSTRQSLRFHRAQHRYPHGVYALSLMATNYVCIPWARGVGAETILDQSGPSQRLWVGVASPLKEGVASPLGAEGMRAKGIRASLRWQPALYSCS